MSFTSVQPVDTSIHFDVPLIQLKKHFSERKELLVTYLRHAAVLETPRPELGTHNIYILPYIEEGGPI